MNHSIQVIDEDFGHRVTTEFVIEHIDDRSSRIRVDVRVDGTFLSSCMVMSGPRHLAEEFASGNLTMQQLSEKMGF